ncbi:MAG: hypothetical protein V2A79_09810 [Planctomycetota bacterium]
MEKAPTLPPEQNAEVPAPGIGYKVIHHYEVGILTGITPEGKLEYRRLGTSRRCLTRPLSPEEIA